MEVVARALVGNYNYGLNHELDIRKFKVFIIPDTIETVYSKKKLGESFPYEVEDIRIWINRLIAGDMLYIETLFSTYVEVSYNDFYYKLHSRRNDISLMNLAGVYNNCMSFYDDNINMLVEDKEKLGQERLLALEIYRQLDFLLRYSQGYNFEKAITYTIEEREYLFNLLMKERMDIEEIKCILQSKKALADGFRPIYMGQNFNKEVKHFLEEVCLTQVQGILL